MDLTALATQIADSYQPPPTGRHSVLQDADTLTELLTAIGQGLGRDAACHLVDISTRTLSRIVERGEAGEEPHARFVKALKREEARCELGIVRNVIKASEKPQFWAAGMTYLERKYPEKWGRRPEDSSAPRVVVQVGGHASDVKVLIQSGLSPAPESALGLSPTSPMPVTLGAGEGEGPANTDPFARQCPISSVMVTPHDHVPGAVGAPIDPGPGARFAGPAPVEGGAPPSTGCSTGKASQRAEISAGKARRVRGPAAKDVGKRRRKRGAARVKANRLAAAARVEEKRSSDGETDAGSPEGARARGAAAGADAA